MFILLAVGDWDNNAFSSCKSVYLDCMGFKVFADPVLNRLSRLKGLNDSKSVMNISFTVVTALIGSSIKSFTPNGVFSLKRFFSSIPIKFYEFYKFFLFRQNTIRVGAGLSRKYFAVAIYTNPVFRLILL